MSVWRRRAQLTRIILTKCTFLFLPFLLLAATVGHHLYGRYDFYYSKFVGRHESAIIGSSRGFFGISPSTLRDNLGWSTPIHNLAITITASPFGPLYLEYLQQKIHGRHGLFIVEVNPFTVSIRDYEDDNSVPMRLRESDWRIARVPFRILSPNLYYMAKFADTQIYRMIAWEVGALITGAPALKTVTADGHMAVNPRANWDGQATNRWERMDFVENFLKWSTYSEVRIDHLDQTIQFLKSHGTVVVVRMPISAEFKEVEDRYFPKFSKFFHTVCQRNYVFGLDYIEDSGTYSTYDPNHLLFDEALRFSRRLALDLRFLGEVPLRAIEERDTTGTGERL